MARRMAAAALAGALLGAVPAAAQVDFRHPLDNRPIDVPLPDGPELTAAVQSFHDTGRNPYLGDPEAAAAGRDLYLRWCQACHKPDGSGGMGPSFLDETWNYPRSATALGQFEVIWAGATGAMQPFKGRLSQDDILKVIAHIDALRRRAGGEEKAEGR